MTTVYEILSALEATPSRNEKEAILKKNINNKTLKAVLLAALNPHINYYIKKIPPYSPASKGAESLDWALTQLNALSSRKFTGNAGIDHLRSVLSALNETDGDVITRVIEKDLRCGVSDSTTNKIFKDLIPSYPVMLASAYDEKLIQKMKFPAAVQTKFDGMRFNAIVKGGDVEFRSRNGKQINLFENLKPEFLELAGKDAFVFDGELLVLNKTGQILPRQEGNGILSKAQKGTITSEQAGMVIAVIWDAIPHNDFVAGKSTIPYNARLSFFSRKLNVLHNTNGLTRIRAARTHTANNLTEVQELYSRALEDGEEGIILKDMNGVWEDKRAKHQIKFKNELECDLLCVGWEQGSGKYLGKLGALVLQSADGKINVSVGSGFTDSNREAIKKKDVVGKIITVKYNARIQNKQGEDSLFLPIFIEIREDKTKADSSKDVK